MLAEIFKPFIEGSAVSVMARGALERLVSPEWADEVFEATAEKQYTRELLFSSVFSLMVRVVCGQAKTVRRAFLPKAAEIAVSLTSVYNKLQGISPTTSAALVRESGQACARVLDEMGGRRPAWLEGYRVRILDGNCIASTQHRIRELRALGAGALPGKALVVYDPELGCVIDSVPCEDGHAQERALLKDVFPMVQAGELWIEDRNFCTREFLFAVVVQASADILVREHKNLPVVAVRPVKKVGKTPTGRVCEQDVELVSEDGEQILSLRRVTIELDNKTRGGDRQIHLLTSLPKSVKATKVANLYRGRWRIETAFQDLQRDLNSEIRTLGYPRAALFGFCVALVAYNVMALVHGALRAVHGAQRIDEGFSQDYLADELKMTHRGMQLAIPDPHWRGFAEMTDRRFAEVLLYLAKHVKLEHFPKARRKKPAKPPPKKKSDPNTPHVSTAKLLAKRKK
jgi:IS4 transposase